MSSSVRWTTYRNPRYNFEFPYPSNWIAFPMPDNRDGQAFRDPQNPDFEIRGWAEFAMLDASSLPRQAPSPQKNFTTNQGAVGKLQVDLGSQTSLMTLTLNQGEVLYNWQGQCQSKQFADCYRFFYYVASQYRLPVPEK
ncbi:MAG TPA: hypothetical protein DDZ80_05575 [Cyanobacteria bacterium UBA8803]|nr:hypothetical protein [Cyanobacteria bacterium UBA9273]HBL58008.1 hypothetical protein [Cyanobacteria bacterium UBA8803]